MQMNLTCALGVTLRKWVLCSVELHFSAIKIVNSMANIAQLNNDYSEGP